LNDLLRLGKTPFARERHHPMRIGENQGVVVDVRLGVIRQHAPTGPDVYPAELQAGEQRGGILDIEVKIRPLAQDGLVIEIERVVGTTGLDEEEREMPP
jgi:hypothetical protein